LFSSMGVSGMHTAAGNRDSRLAMWNSGAQSEGETELGIAERRRLFVDSVGACSSCGSASCLISRRAHGD
jgi:hypothetical protein